MVSGEQFLVSVPRALIEVAGLALLGQGALHILAGASREKNGIYLLLRMIANPAVKIVRLLTPKAILDRHVPFLTFFILFWLWIALAYLRQQV